jgi:hypothetical protein
VAHFAVRLAGAAGDGVTAETFGHTFVTKPGRASSTRERIFRAPVAVLAALPVPITEFDVGAGRVVGFQRLPHDQEEVEQPPLPERVLNRHTGIARAESVAIDMRVRHVVVAGGWKRIDGDHLVRIAAADAVDVQHDVERAQVDVLQFDGRRLAGDLGLVQVDLDFVELTMKGEHVVVNVRRGHDRRRR